MDWNCEEFVWSLAAAFSEGDHQLHLALTALFLALGNAERHGNAARDPIAVRTALKDWSLSFERRSSNLRSAVERIVESKLGRQFRE
jgi:hypothetical protein